MPRGRPKKNATSPRSGVEVPQPAPDSSSAASILNLKIDGLPPQKVKGEWNPEYFAVMLDLANKRYYQTVLVEGGNSQFNYSQFQKGVIDAAKMVGITEREILDRRTPEQRSEDVLKLLAADTESMLGIPDEDLEAFDRVLATLEERMDSADKQVHDVLEGILVTEEESRAERMGVGAAGRAAIEELRSPKAWRRRIAQIRRLRHRAKTRVPTSHGLFVGNQHTERNRPGLLKQSLHAAHLLRFMIYVGRISMDPGEQHSTKKVEPADLIFDIGPHHAKFAGTLWCHRTGAKPMYDEETDSYQYRMGVTPYLGSVQIMPIGHGKSELAIHWCGLEIGENPRDPGIYVHAVEDVAVSNLLAIKRFLDPEVTTGQRYLALFPLKLSGNQNSSKKIRVHLKNPPKSPTWVAAGVDSARSGIDADKQVLDDCVPQDDAYEETTRKRRLEKIQGTFISRKRSRKAFTLIIANLWHHGDATMQIIDKAKKAAEGKPGLCFGVCIQRCGGPKATEKVGAWQVLWPKMYNVARLKGKYEELGPSMYAAAMMCDPLTNEQRIVKEIRLYTPLNPDGTPNEEHEAFKRASTKYISLDPAATRTSNSDKAGIVYGGVGPIRVVQNIEGTPAQGTEMRLRLMRYHEIHATQSDLVDYTFNFAKLNDVDYVLCEVVAGFRGIQEMFQNRGLDTIGLQPRGKDKESRLRGVGPAIDDSSRDTGHRAVVEWPGVWVGEGDEKELKLDPSFHPLYEQIVNFKVCAEDNGCDALTYLVGHVAPDLSIGRGIVSVKAREVDRVAGDPRLQAIIKRMMGKDQPKEGPEEEHRWLTQNWR